MSKFIIDKSFFELFPQAKLGVVLVDDIKSNSNSPKELQDYLRKSAWVAKDHLTSAIFSDNEVIKIYREAYNKFNCMKKARSSVEMMLKRASKDAQFSSINPLVDIYNSVGLRFAFPCGAEDINKFSGNLILGITKGGDEFYRINSTENEPTLAGELCYYDDKGDVCRNFNWQDGERTKIDENTKKAFCVIELLDTNRLKDLNEALKTLAELFNKYLGSKSSIHLLDVNNTTLELI